MTPIAYTTNGTYYFCGSYKAMTMIFSTLLCDTLAMGHPSDVYPRLTDVSPPTVSDHTTEYYYMSIRFELSM